MENLRNGLQNENPEAFINPIFEIEVIRNEEPIPELKQITKQPLLFIIHQFLKDYPLYQQKFGIDDKIVVIFRMEKNKEIRMPLFLKTLPDDWTLGQEIPGGVIYEKQPPA